MQIIKGHELNENSGVVPSVQQSGFEYLRSSFIWTQTRIEQSFQKTRRKWRQNETKDSYTNTCLPGPLSWQGSPLVKAHLQAQTFSRPPELPWTFRTPESSKSLWKAGVSVCPLLPLPTWPCTAGCHCLLLSQPTLQRCSRRVWSFPSRHRAAMGRAKRLPSSLPSHPIEYA